MLPSRGNDCGRGEKLPRKKSDRERNANRLRYLLDTSVRPLRHNRAVRWPPIDLIKSMFENVADADNSHKLIGLLDGQVANASLRHELHHIGNAILG